MKKINKHIIGYNQSLRDALKAMNELDSELTLFVVDEKKKLIGTLTDGDCRRGLLNGFNIDDSIENFMNKSFFFIEGNKVTIHDLHNSKIKRIKILPVIDINGCIIRLIDFSFYYSYLPLDAIIMAGGEGIRLRPLTEGLPKPMLTIGEKPILEHVLDRLIKFGVNSFQISINYLGDKITDYFKNGSDKGVSISYIRENQKMGTIGSLSLVKELKNDYLLIINSDVLTNIDYEDFFIDFITKGADISVATIPYSVSIPYAIMDTKEDEIIGLKEKPTLNFVTNAGIYLLKKEHVNRVPVNKFYNATDLIEEMINSNLNVTYYTVLDYWLDIGKMDDYNKAQLDIRHIKL